MVQLHTYMLHDFTRMSMVSFSTASGPFRNTISTDQCYKTNQYSNVTKFAYTLACMYVYM